MDFCIIIWLKVSFDLVDFNDIVCLTLWELAMFSQRIPVLIPLNILKEIKMIIGLLLKSSCLCFGILNYLLHSSYFVISEH